MWLVQLSLQEAVGPHPAYQQANPYQEFEMRGLPVAESVDSLLRKSDRDEGL